MSVIPYPLFNLFQLPEKIYKNLDLPTRIMRYTVPLPMLAYPIYLVRAYILTLSRISIFQKNKEEKIL